MRPIVNFSTAAQLHHDRRAFTWPSGTYATVAQEKINFANWYTYHRTRTKVAKAGVSYAFNDTSIFNADNAYRVGFTTIWQRNEFRIPVGTDNGLFRNTRAKSQRVWFDRLFGATASNGTPLKAALIRAGQYYEENGTGGPWGPQATANQYECRQNFSILTTDGFWNSTEGQRRWPAWAIQRWQQRQRHLASRTVRPTPTRPAAPFSDAWNNTLADVAMHYWKRDLRSDLTNGHGAHFVGVQPGVLAAHGDLRHLHRPARHARCRKHHDPRAQQPDRRLAEPDRCRRRSSASTTCSMRP